MAVTTDLTLEQLHRAGQVDALDLEPIVYKLMHPHPGEPGMTLTEADQLIELYRRFLKLCAWYPGESIVPTRAIDKAWHTHILDTGKYAGDSHAVFGYFLHHFPYFGMRGAEDTALWQAAAARTCELFRAHFGITLSSGRNCHNGGQSCNANGFCNGPGGSTAARSGGWQNTLERPRPVRAG